MRRFLRPQPFCLADALTPRLPVGTGAAGVLDAVRATLAVPPFGQRLMAQVEQIFRAASELVEPLPTLSPVAAQIRVNA